MTRFKKIIPGLLILVFGIYGLWIGYKWTVMRVYVPPNKGLIVINKFGQPLPAGMLVVPADDNSFKGVQEAVRGPGRYFINPVTHDYKLVDLVEISAGDPNGWNWNPDGELLDPASAPQIGLVIRKDGKTAPPGQEVVDVGFKGIQREVLTPGTYKINPYQLDVRAVPAIVIPPGSVGVATRLAGESSIKSSIVPVSLGATTEPATTQPASTQPAGMTVRGILADVLQPGIYYLNPRMTKITVMPIGFDAVTLEAPANPIRFYSNDGYQIEADFTVIWGRGPADAPSLVANIGTTDRVKQNVIEPMMKAACQNEGGKYTAKQLIQGATREKFQLDLYTSLERQLSSRNIDILLVLVRNITIKDNTGKDATDTLIGTIQRANIEIEKQLTNRQKTETATVQANYEEALKLVDVAREIISGETNIKVANLMAEGTKAAAQIGAQREVDVSKIELEIAQIEAKRAEILGRAQADVERLKNDAEAKGAKLLIGAFGSPQAYNNYIFAKNFNPEELRLIFAGPGTMWTDLKSFQDMGARKVVQESQGK